MNPELANRLLLLRWDPHTARYATKANCPHCSKPMKKGQRVGMRNDWFWYCENIECIKKHGGGWRANCFEDPPKEN